MVSVVSESFVTFSASIPVYIMSDLSNDTELLSEIPVLQGSEARLKN